LKVLFRLRSIGRNGAAFGFYDAGGWLGAGVAAGAFAVFFAAGFLADDFLTSAGFGVVAFLPGFFFAGFLDSFAAASFLARYSAHRFFVAAPILFRAAAFIFRLAGAGVSVAGTLADLGALIPSFRRSSATFDTISACRCRSPINAASRMSWSVFVGGAMQGL